MNYCKGRTWGLWGWQRVGFCGRERSSMLWVNVLSVEEGKGVGVGAVCSSLGFPRKEESESVWTGYARYWTRQSGSLDSCTVTVTAATDWARLPMAYFYWAYSGSSPNYHCFLTSWHLSQPHSVEEPRLLKKWLVNNKEGPAMWRIL